MEWLDVLRRIEAGENSQTEFKRNFGGRSAVGRPICAFANGMGGILVLGVDDSGAVVGVNEDPQLVQERLTSLLNTGCGQPVSASTGYHRTGEGWVHWVTVPRQRRRYQPFSVDGRFWIRRGRSTVAPSSSELQDLFNAFGLIFTEEQVVASASVSDIDLDAFRSFMREQGRNIDDDPQPPVDSELRSASICELLDGVLRPTLYGLMVFGRNPQEHPHTLSMFIQCAAYAGGDRSADVVSTGEAKGRLDEQVQRSMGWFRSLGRKERYRGLYRLDDSLVPEPALREALVNAVIHREYSTTGSHVLFEVFDDRIDVTSPGNLPNHMTVAQARGGGAPRSRNEMMANAMVVRRLMERRGRGWLLMRKEMREFNNTEPSLENREDGRFVRVRFHLGPNPLLIDE